MQRIRPLYFFRDIRNPEKDTHYMEKRVKQPEMQAESSRFKLLLDVWHESVNLTKNSVFQPRLIPEQRFSKKRNIGEKLLSQM